MNAGIEIASDRLVSLIDVTQSAHDVSISFIFLQEHLWITVEDDGKGFDVSKQGNRTESKFGINIMKEHASQIRARIEINSVIGKGSKIILCVPIAREEI